MSDEKVTAEDVFVLGGSYSTSKYGRAREAAFRAAIESLCAERDQAQKHLEHETAAHLATIETRDYFEETIQECHFQLGGDGEWSNVHDLAEELPEMICEAQAEAERLREENALAREAIRKMCMQVWTREGVRVMQCRNCAQLSLIGEPFEHLKYCIVRRLEVQS